MMLMINNITYCLIFENFQKVDSKQILFGNNSKDHKELAARLISKDFPSTGCMAEGLEFLSSHFRQRYTFNFAALHHLSDDAVTAWASSQIQEKLLNSKIPTGASIQTGVPNTYLDILHAKWKTDYSKPLSLVGV